MLGVHTYKISVKILYDDHISAVFLLCFLILTQQHFIMIFLILFDMLRRYLSNFNINIEFCEDKNGF